MMKKTFTSIFIFSILQNTFSQEAIVKGRVSEAKSNEALPGVILSADNTPTAASDANGFYRFKIAAGLHTLTFKMLGYKSFSKQIAIGNSDSLVLNVRLEDESTALNTVVVSAGRYEQKLSDVTVSMEVIQPALVENKNTTTLDNILDQVPGVAVVDGQTSIRGGSGYSYGAGSRVLLLVDDLPMLSAEASDVKWSFLPTENLQQIEVIKGASSTLYGSSALNGVINVRTAFPSDTAITKVNTSYSVYNNPRRMELKWWGNNIQSFEGANFMHSQKIGNFDLVLGGCYFNDMGYRELETVERYRFNFNTRYRFQSIPGLSVGLNGNIMQENGGLFLLWENAGAGGYLPQGGTVQDYKDTRSSLDPYAVWYAPNGDRHSLRTRYFNTTNLNNTGQGSIGNFYYAEYQYQRKFRKNFTIVAGAVASYSDVKAMDIYGDHTGHNIAGYVQAEKKIQRLTLVAGIRAENNKVDTAVTKQTILGIPAKPVFRAGMNYQLYPLTFLRASFGQGYRFPSIAEKFISTNADGIQIYPNPGLQPETGWSSEIGIKQGFKVGGFNGYFDVAGFMMQYKNMMEFTFGYFTPDSIKKPSPFQQAAYAGFQSQNIGSSQITGIDITVGGTGKIDAVTVILMAGYTYTDPIYLGFNPAKDTTGSSSTNILKYRYHNSFKGDVQLDYKRWSFGTSVRYTGFMVNIDKKFVEPLFSEVLPTWQIYLLPGLEQYREIHDKGDLVFDSRLSYRCTKNFRLGLIVNNVFNRETMPRPGSIGPPRTTGLQVSWKF